MFAQSGQLHSSSIWRGFGNRPRSGSETTAITWSESDPRSSSRIEPICPEHALRIAFQVAAGSGFTRMETR